MAFDHAALMAMGPFAQWAAHLLDGGYSPVPIRVGEKRPILDGWNRLRSTALKPREIEQLVRAHPGLGLGVAGGYRGLVPIDIDTDDVQIVDAACAALPEPTVIKVGKRGFTAFYRGNVKARKYRAADDNMLVEVLVTGQSVLPPTMHPDTRRPYR